MRLLNINIIIYLVIAKCRTRQSIYSLTNTQVRDLKNSFEMIYKDNTITKLANKHWELRKRVHGCAQFLPFHNIFLYELETNLRRYNNNITLPYWNWTIYANDPLKDPVLLWFGDNYKERIDNCTTSNFKWIFKSECLKRTYNNKSGNHLQWPIINRLISTNNYTTMERYLEQSHAYMHVWIGGSMITHYSPRDPLFYLHHTFIDKIWYDWQHKFNNYTYTGLNCDKSKAYLSDKIVGTNINVSSIV